MIDVDVLSWGLTGGHDPGLARSIVELSTIIEPAAAALAARRRSREDMDALQRALGEIMRCRSRSSQRVSAARVFHGQILIAARSPALVAMGAAVSAAADQRLLHEGSGRDCPRDDLSSYTALVNAIRAGDESRAEMEMRRLVAKTPQGQHGSHTSMNVERASAQGEDS